MLEIIEATRTGKTFIIINRPWMDKFYTITITGHCWNIYNYKPSFRQLDGMKINLIDVTALKNVLAEQLNEDSGKSKELSRLIKDLEEVLF